MRRTLGALAATALAACAIPSARSPDPALSTTRAVQLARVRCLLVAPLENASDEPLVADAATGALVSAIDANRTSVYPLDDLRALFEHTPLELPPGVSASLALELGELVSADAVLYGSVEGRVRGPEPDVTLTVRLAATGVRDTLFWRSVRVAARAEESLVDAARRAALEAAQPILERMGIPGRKVCFDRQRLDRVRLLARAAERPVQTSNPVTAPLPPSPEPVGSGPQRAEVARAVGESAPLPPPPPPPPTATPTPTSTSTSTPTPTPTPTSTSTSTGALSVEIVSSPSVLSRLRDRARTNRELASATPGSSPAARPPGAREALSARQEAFAARLARRERFVVEDVSFDGRSPVLVEQEGLADLAAALASSPTVNVRIEGFVDAGKSERDDLKASMELARAAGRRLAELGVSRDRVTWAGRGRDAPVAPNFTARGRAANRRVEVVVQ